MTTTATCINHRFNGTQIRLVRRNIIIHDQVKSEQITMWRCPPKEGPPHVNIYEGSTSSASITLFRISHPWSALTGFCIIMALQHDCFLSPYQSIELPFLRVALTFLKLKHFYHFFLLALLVEYTFWTTFYGLYFNHQFTHYITQFLQVLTCSW